MPQLPQSERRLTPRTQVGNIISISIGAVTPAFLDKTEQEENTNRFRGQIDDISDKGMGITTLESIDEYSFIEISVIQDSQHTTKDTYSGVIVWSSYNQLKNNYRYGIEFISSWIRRKTNRTLQKHERRIYTSSEEDNLRRDTS